MTTKYLPHILISFSAISLLGLGAYLFAKKKKDKNAMNFYNEVEKSLIPNNTFNNSVAFDVNYWKNIPSGSKLLNNDEAIKLAENLDSYFGWEIPLVGRTNVDEEKIYSLFKSLESKAQISQIAYQYFTKYSTTLDLAIKDALYDDEQLTVTNIINSKVDNLKN